MHVAATATTLIGHLKASHRHADVHREHAGDTRCPP